MSENTNSEKPVMQECMACNKSFNALMYSCPHCGAGGESMMAGGMEMVEIMQRKFKASDLNDQGVRFYQQGKISEALSSLQEALTVNPMHEKAHENLGGILLQLGRLEEARNVLEKLLSINPRREDGRRYMAEVKSKLDRRTVKQVPLPSQSSPATAIAAQKPSRKWYQFWQ